MEQLEDRSCPSVGAGVLDPSFGTGGQSTAPFSTTAGVLCAVAIQSNGQVIAGGPTTAADGSPDSTFGRYNANGSLDTTFGTGGFLATDFGSNVQFVGDAVAVEPDGNIVVAGSAIGANGTQDFALAEYNANGILNTGFGNNGLVTTDFNGGDDYVFGLALQSNGDIVAVGVTFQQPSNNGDFALARYTEAGALDTSFGTNGLVITSFGDGFDAAQAAAIQSNGQIVVVGAGFANANFTVSATPQFEIARYNSDGSLDTTFGTGGLVATNFPTGPSNAYAVALQSDGSILVGGTVWGASNSFDFALARYTASGTLDSTFGTGGLVVTDFNGETDAIGALAIQSNGQIIAAGEAESATTGYDFALARYNTNGSLDTTFGNNGLVTTDFNGGDDWVLAVAIQSNSEILAIGGTTQGNTTQVAMALYGSGLVSQTSSTSSSTPTTTTTSTTTAETSMISPQPTITSSPTTSTASTDTGSGTISYASGKLALPTSSSPTIDTNSGGSDPVGTTEDSGTATGTSAEPESSDLGARIDLARFDATEIARAFIDPVEGGPALSWMHVPLVPPEASRQVMEVQVSRWDREAPSSLAVLVLAPLAAARPMSHSGFLRRGVKKYRADR